MRFTIAVAVLVNSLSSDHGPKCVVQARRERKDLHATLLHMPASKRSSIAQKAATTRRRSAEKRGVLRNLVAQDSSPRGECDPDVGLLACGFGQVCQSSKESSRGGLCLPIPETSFARDLQVMVPPFTLPANCTDCLSGPGVYCDPGSPFFGKLSCDCEDWTVSNRTGSIACNLSEYLCNENCTDTSTCYSVDFSYVTDGSEISYQYCYEFLSPTEQSFCFGYTNDQTCNIALDGTSCTSCNTTYQLNCAGGSCSSEPCAIFDCENVGLGSGNSCQDRVIPPAYYQCWLDINDIYPQCSVCPASASVLYPEKELQVPGFGTYNCTYLERIANEGRLSPQLCTYAAQLAQEICCSMNQAPFLCNICEEEDHIVSKPEALIDIPSRPSISCGDLESLAAKGAVDESQCGIVQGFVKVACGCKNPDDTNSPTSAPQVTDPTPGPVDNKGSDAFTPSRRSHLSIALALSATFVYAVMAN